MNDDQNLDDLLNDLADDCVDDGFRDAVLGNALAASRERVVRRRTGQAAMVVVTAICVGLAGWRMARPTSDQSQTLVADLGPAGSEPQPLETKMIPGTDIRVINDEELLALFPDRPVALIRKGDRTELVFLDEQPR